MYTPHPFERRVNEDTFKPTFPGPGGMVPNQPGWPYPGDPNLPYDPWILEKPEKGDPTEDALDTLKYIQTEKPDYRFKEYEDGDEFVVKVEVPGFEEEYIEVYVEGRTLHVKAERPIKGNNLRKGIHHTSKLPGYADLRKRPNAVYRKGVVEVSVPIRKYDDLEKTNIPLDTVE